MKNYLIYAGVPSTDFETIVSGVGTFDAPERDKKIVAIPGRNGDLTLDNGRYLNTKVEYPAYIAKNFKKNAEGLRNYLLSLNGYNRLEDTYHPDEFRLARYSGGFTSGSTKGMHAGSFKLTFDCMPQRYLKSGEEYIGVSDGYTLLNPTLMTALPLIRVSTLDSSGWIQIGSLKVSIGRVGTTVIDCEMQEAYDGWDGTINCNSYITLNNGSFPCLTPGENSIALANCTASIMPRWWRL